MKNLKTLSLLTLILTISIFTACTQEGDEFEINPNFDASKYTKLSNEIANDFKKLNSRLKKREISITNKNEVLKILKSDTKSLTSNTTFQPGDFYNMSHTQETRLKQMIENAFLQNSPNQAISYLDNEFNNLTWETNLAYDDLDFLLLNNVVIKQYIGFLISHDYSFDYSLKAVQKKINTNSESSTSWWDCMKNTAGSNIGRGIVGGFTTGFVAGGIAGAAGGTAVVPVVGTVVGGVGVAVVGGSVGAVRGAALGAFWSAVDCL